MYVLTQITDKHSGFVCMIMKMSSLPVMESWAWVRAVRVHGWIPKGSTIQYYHSCIMGEDLGILDIHLIYNVSSALSLATHFPIRIVYWFLLDPRLPKLVECCPITFPISWQKRVKKSELIIKEQRCTLKLLCFNTKSVSVPLTRHVYIYNSGAFL